MPVVTNKGAARKASGVGPEYTAKYRTNTLDARIRRLNSVFSTSLDVHRSAADTLRRVKKEKASLEENAAATAAYWATVEEIGRWCDDATAEFLRA